MARFTNTIINAALRKLRTNIREGKTIVYYRENNQLKRLVVAHLFEATTELSDAFSTEYFNPQTLRRFEVLFDVPTYQDNFPTQDDAATALQNFINRRSDPWAHVRPSTSDLEAAAMLQV